jgi:hypothetical protein
VELSIPADLFVQELARRGIGVETEVRLLV